jgi:hypothetical protein
MRITAPRLPAPRFIAAALAAATLGACATPVPPIEATRFHMNQPIAPGSIAVEPFDTRESAGLEFQVYAEAVRAELARIGFTPATGAASELIATVDVRRGTRESLRARGGGLSIGLGGGTGGYGSGFGVGGGLSFPVGGSRSNAVTLTELTVQIKRRSDGTIVWEGRARSERAARSPAADPDNAVRDLAAALFRGFPGESGRTIQVK